MIQFQPIAFLTARAYALNISPKGLYIENNPTPLTGGGGNMVSGPEGSVADPDPLLQGMDPGIWLRILLSSRKNSKINLDSYCFVTSLWLFSLENNVNVPSKSNKQKKLYKKISFLLASWRSMTKIAGSGSISQSHGSADPDPDPYQNVMDPEHCFPHSYTQQSAANCTFTWYPTILSHVCTVISCWQVNVTVPAYSLLTAQTYALIAYWKHGPWAVLRIRILLLLSSKTSKINLDSYCFVTSVWL